MRYIFFLFFFAVPLWAMDSQNQASYCIVKNYLNGRNIIIFDPDGNKLASGPLDENFTKKIVSGILKTEYKPRPIKAVISPHLTLGRSLGFFDKHNNLVGSWRCYDGGEDLQKVSSEERSQFADIDISCLQEVEDRGGASPAPNKRIIRY